MGVDAEILVKIKRKESWLTADQLRKASSQLTATIGKDKFSLRPEENKHALYFTEDVWREYADEDIPPGTPVVYQQDGDDIVAEPAEQFIGVNVWSRYYGEDYARGDWPSLYFTIIWLQKNIKDSEVWYGGDSSGVCAKLMTPGRLAKITDFYAKSGGDTYWMNKPTGYQCEFCQRGVVNSGSGGGGSREFYRCSGCGTEWLLQNRTLVTKWDNDEKIKGIHSSPCFEMSQQVQDGTRPLYPFDGTFRQKYGAEAS